MFFVVKNDLQLTLVANEGQVGLVSVNPPFIPPCLTAQPGRLFLRGMRKRIHKFITYLIRNPADARCILFIELKVLFSENHFLHFIPRIEP